MALLKFFKVPRHQRYKYIPRYWDPKKEEMEERLKRIKGTKEGNIEATKARIAGGFRRGYSNDLQARRASVFRSNMLLLGIIALLLFASYMFMIKYLPVIVEALEGTGASS